MMIDLRPIAERQLEAETAYRLAGESDNRLELLERLDRWEAALDAAVALNARLAEAEASDAGVRESGTPSGDPDVPLEAR